MYPMKLSEKSIKSLTFFKVVEVKNEYEQQKRVRDLGFDGDL